MATFNTELHRDGPGLLLRDLVRATDPQIEAVLAVLALADADILALQGFDYDLTAEALSLFAERAGYPFHFALRPNTGMPTGLDLDGDGKTGGPRDAQGYGTFSGQGGMAILSRYPIVADAVRNFSDLLWADLPGALLTRDDGTPLLSAPARAVQRLSTTGHWVVPIDLPGSGRIELMTFHASPPVFDGPEDRNGRRNHDEILFWRAYLDGAFGAPPRVPFVLLGDFNLDPVDGDGRKHAIRTLLGDPRLQDSAPTGAAGTDTADWTDPVPGDLRVDYVLPSSQWQVTDSAVLWPDPGTPDEKTAATASRHRLVWVDLVLP